MKISWKVVIVPMFVAWLVIASGCDPSGEKEKRKNKVVTVAGIDLRDQDFPFRNGEIVSLKPDNVPAVIVGTDTNTYAKGQKPTGTYEVKYDADGEGYDIVKLVNVTTLAYFVRYPITKEHTKTHILDEDEPTKVLHYETTTVNWYEINEKIKVP